MSILFSILLFSLLIFLHELGHFVAAKLSGVQVNEFAMFMGPAIVKWERGGTLYSIRCIPFGGYCAMEGEDGGSENPRSFAAAKRWKRLIILAAGSFMNFIAGILIIAVVLFGAPGYASTELGTVEEWSYLTAENGLRPGDVLLELDGTDIDIYEDFSLKVMNLPNGHYDMVVLRDGQRLELEDVPMIRQRVVDQDGKEQSLYGISFADKETTADSVWGRILPTAANHVESVIVSLKMLVSGDVGMNDLSGPVGIVQIMSETAEQSETTGLALLNMLSIGGFIAINLAVMNMLPIPALDGGRIFGLLITAIIEKITRKKLDPKYEGYIHGIGMILLLLLMALILFKDVFTIFKG